MKKIYLSLGSNIGDRAENIIFALSFLQSCGFVNILKISSFYETSPVGLKQRFFYNIAVQGETSLSAKDLLALLKQAEKICGRKPSLRRGPRSIDMDILFYENKKIKSRKLIIPHKEIQNRLFVLCPLNEIAPGFVHPVLKKTIKEILKDNQLTLKNQKVRIITL